MDDVENALVLWPGLVEVVGDIEYALMLDCAGIIGAVCAATSPGKPQDLANSCGRLGLVHDEVCQEGVT